MIERCRAASNWLFRDRQTGEIVVVQFPNVPLFVWSGATVLTVLLRPAGLWRTALVGVATVALVVWAGEEIIRGVNPWRRFLGATVLCFVAVSLVARLAR